MHLLSEDGVHYKRHMPTNMFASLSHAHAAYIIGYLFAAVSDRHLPALDASNSIMRAVYDLGTSLSPWMLTENLYA